MKKSILFFAMFFLHSGGCFAFSVDLQWIPVEGASGYVIYYGQTSRHDASLDIDGIYRRLQNRCDIPTVPPVPNRKICKRSWAEFCGNNGLKGDRLCDPDFFDYDKKIKVAGGRVKSHRLNLPDNKIYFVTITAYEDQGEITVFKTNRRESPFSVELKLEDSGTDRPPNVSTPENFKINRILGLD